MTADEFSEKWGRRLKGSTEDIRKGVDRVTKAPGEQAAKQVAKMRANLVAAIDSGKWGKRVASVTLDDWKTDMKEKGINRISAGVDGAAEDMKDFAQQLLPAISAAQSKIENMPSITLEDNISRSAAFLREMAKFQRK